MSDVNAEAMAATALAYRDSSAVVMNKHREQARAVLDALSNAGFALVDRATLDQLRDCYGDEFVDGLAPLPATKEQQWS